jgi:large subunit ribosomal protein L33
MVKKYIILKCVEAKKGKFSPSEYIFKKSKKNISNKKKITIRKYNYNVRRHTIHKEIRK